MDATAASKIQRITVKSNLLGSVCTGTATRLA